MTAPAQAIAVLQALETVLRHDRGRLMAALTHRLGSLQRAEDALQEASLSALSHWARDGLPQSPQGWLIKVAFRKALDQIRAEGRDGEREAAVQLVNELLGQDDPESIPDERLRLIFTCCHPALETKSRVALTLRTVWRRHCGAKGPDRSRSKRRSALARWQNPNRTGLRFFICTRRCSLSSRHRWYVSTTQSQWPRTACWPPRWPH